MVLHRALEPPLKNSVIGLCRATGSEAGHQGRASSSGGSKLDSGIKAELSIPRSRSSHPCSDLALAGQFGSVKQAARPNRSMRGGRKANDIKQERGGAELARIRRGLQKLTCIKVD